MFGQIVTMSKGPSTRKRFRVRFAFKFQGLFADTNCNRRPLSQKHHVSRKISHKFNRNQPWTGIVRGFAREIVRVECRRPLNGTWAYLKCPELNFNRFQSPLFYHSWSCFRSRGRRPTSCPSTAASTFFNAWAATARANWTG